MSRLRSDDTIAAIATPAGSGGVGIVRISGPRALSILEGLSGKPASSFADRTMVYGHARHGDGERLDDVLFVAMRGPRSFTGEDVVEIHGHGGVANMGRLLRAAVDSGARLADAGEFTRRAFENGRLDLTGAEALLGVIEASSERGLRVAQAQLDGQLGLAVRDLRERCTAMLATIEATIDFPEDGVPATEWAEFCASGESLGSQLSELVASFDLGRALRSGITVVLTGPVNAGKSSLLNALAGRERALVSAEPGTTRDYVEVDLVWSGLPVTLVDTAGERKHSYSEDLETRGFELGQRRASEADVELALVPPGGVIPSPSPRALVVGSKADLGKVEGADVQTSATTGEGLEKLRSAVVDKAIPKGRDADDGLIVTSERQRDHIAGAHRALTAALGHGSDMPELIAADLREVNERLAQCLGEQIGDEVLDDLFARFCIGK
ncbi:MAG: tRNA modification GTPase [Deltaproteobacteria bacterium]|nr:tRNA modification GTPase [Deltaproteobacteria bacterium]